MKLADAQAGLVQRHFQTLAVEEQRHALAVLDFQLRALGGNHGLLGGLAGRNEDVVGRCGLGRVAVDEEHARAIGRFLELAGRDAVHVAALLILRFQFLNLLIGPRPDDQRQRGDGQHHRPGKAQQRRQQVHQATAAGEPDDHLAVAVHAREYPHDGNEQAKAQNGG
ncbi:hypothetical protein SDC9_171909 [bioreactor metagenome]|uniref:Uncharacterized protein n=1 Tax=bioreactor metagenome TaxID=1076179 RepID=A0A645GEJ2_9ZZZZ